MQIAHRLLDGGADVNVVVPKQGTPLEAATARPKYSDRTLRKWYAKRGELAERLHSPTALWRTRYESRRPLRPAAWAG